MHSVYQCPVSKEVVECHYPESVLGKEIFPELTSALSVMLLAHRIVDIVMSNRGRVQKDYLY